MILYVANRGEIARRILKTARKMGFKTAVGYAKQDKDLPFVSEADLAIALDGEEALETYLDYRKVITAAIEAGATHIHPGYGFLSENPQFVDLVHLEGIQFVGPKSESMRKLGDKIGSRNFLKNYGIPLLPAYDGDDQTDDRLLSEAKKLGFPLLIKPSAGGGGKGMIRVDREEDFLTALSSSKRIARAAFADTRIFLERFIEKARHIEVQILGDTFGNIFALGERECSLQRRHQKVIEEAPCVFLKESIRKKLLEYSKSIAQAAHYHSLGTIEWIWGGKNEIYFLEVNARLQVEHPVTELIFGVDLVELQLKVALGENLKDLKFKAQGHAIEARLTAEDPSREFLPSGGKIHKLRLPENVRLDFGFKEKNIIPPQFDSLLGKIIAYSDTREQARLKLLEALKEVCVFGPATNRGFLIHLLESNEMISGDISTGLIAAKPYHFDVAKALSYLKGLKNLDLSSASDDLDFFSPWGEVHGLTQKIDYEDYEDKRYFHTDFGDWSTDRPRRKIKVSDTQSSEMESNEIRSPMPAKVTKVLVKRGAQIEKGATLLVLEAMKMEHQLKAPKATIIEEVFIKEGERVNIDQLLIKLGMIS